MRSGFTPTVILWVDGSVYDDDSEQMNSSGSLLVCNRSVKKLPAHHGLTTWVGDGAFTHKSTPTELCVNGSTGCCAARWAVALGCNPVYLVGMEAAYRDGETDFYGQNDHHAPKTVCIMAKEMRRLIRECGEVVERVASGEMLRKIAEELPQQYNIRSAVSAAIK